MILKEDTRSWRRVIPTAPASRPLVSNKKGKSIVECVPLFLINAEQSGGRVNGIFSSKQCSLYIQLHTRLRAKNIQSSHKMQSILFIRIIKFHWFMDDEVIITMTTSESVVECVEENTKCFS